MNDNEMKQEAERRIEKIKAFQCYTLALSKVKEYDTESSIKYFEDALALYIKVCNNDRAIFEDFDIIIDILTRLGKHELTAFFVSRRKEAKDKADWDRWLFLKNKFGDKE
jgi:hypothetical protein